MGKSKLSKELVEAQEKLKDTQAAIAKFKEDNPAPKTPNSLVNTCPRCKAKPNKLCVTFTGKETTTHADREKLNQEAVDKWNKTLNEQRVKRYELDNSLLEANKRINTIERLIKEEEQTEAFIKRTYPANDKECELVIERHGGELKVVKARNVVGVWPGVVVPCVEAAEELMKKGVDVTIVEEVRERIYPRWHPFFGIM